MFDYKSVLLYKNLYCNNIPFFRQLCPREWGEICICILLNVIFENIEDLGQGCSSECLPSMLKALGLILALKRQDKMPFPILSE
jgi:hypothetical protein